jgi:leucyl-tRNA synthetase
MSNYNPQEIEKKWQKHWKDTQAYKVANSSTKPKYYVLDMFPYPSGAGLHVGHPLGYIASDIVARYKRHKQFNVLHPMGFDAFGLPAEQYAIQTGQHPAVTTAQNIARYKEQLDNIGFGYDWDREVQTCDPEYYKWTQWIFCQLFSSWYDKTTDKACPISDLTDIFSKEGNANVNAHGDETPVFTAAEWNAKSEEEQQQTLLNYRMAYLANSMVNWCPELGTVLANEEVKDGLSERGGYPVFRVNMRQWFLRITAYADRLLYGLDEIDWTDALKEQQRNWIGRSEGASIVFEVEPLSDLSPNPSPQERGTEEPTDETEFDQSLYRHTTPELWKNLIAKAKTMRSNPTEAENELWQRLRANKQGIKFRRQHIIDKYIVDFVSLSHNLVIEVDGDIHDVKQEEDQARTAKLNELGFEVIRFKNEEVLTDPYTVAKKVTDYCQQREVANTGATLPPSPAVWGRGRGQNEGETSAEGTIPPLLWRGAGGEVKKIEVFSTRPDTIYGATFMVLAPEHELVPAITTAEQKDEVDKYIDYAGKRSERDRMSEVKAVTGCFTGAYATNPLTGQPIPIWIADYVLAGYGTGAVMAVPGHDSRDYAFAKHFGLPIVQVVTDKNNTINIDTESFDAKDGVLINSDILNGLSVTEAKKAIIAKLEAMGIGKGKVNYRLRDAGFSRQRYWGEPFPVVYRNGLPYLVDESELPVTLPEVESYKPTGDGNSPLAALTDWVNTPNGQRETNTMPGWAGSSWYFLRYMDPKNNNEFASKENVDYWENVDLYLGGSEHATGHLLYVRFWTKFLYDIGKIPFTEPAKKLINQGMIQGVSEKAYKVLGVSFVLDRTETGDQITYLKHDINTYIQKRFDFICHEKINIPPTYTIDGRTTIDIYISEELTKDFEDVDIFTTLSNIPIDFVDKDKTLNITELVESSFGKNSFKIFLVEGGVWISDRYYKINEGNEKFYTTPEVEKMSKSKWNVVNPDDMVAKYGADTLRLYEMFLGPLEQSKPWNTNGIEGVYRFLGKLWKLYNIGEDGKAQLTNDAPTPEELKILHKTIKKTAEDIENFSFNTTVSAFMICVNELTQAKCNKLQILQPLLVCLSPYAPHIAEELWAACGNSESILDAEFPAFNPEYLVENTFSYPVSINGKTREQIEFPLDADEETIKAAVLANETVQKWVEGKPVKKFILVKGRIINVVV